jgi:pyruvate-formate lyase
MLRKAELERIARMCEWVPVNPARSFYKALQSIWCTYIVLMMDRWGTGMSLGRPDQYLYPFYKKDIEEVRITREEARDLIALLYILGNYPLTPRSFCDILRVMGGYGND